MSKRKSSIANDSLELLLDTMCNTFGGVMFVAIALVIISSLMPVNTIASKDKIDQAKIDKVNQEINNLEKEINTIQRQNTLKEKLIKSHSVIDTQKYIDRLASLKDENTVLQNKIRQQENQLRMTATDIKIKQHEKDKIETTIKDNITQNSEQLATLNKLIEKTQQQIKKILDETLKNEERLVGFAQLTRTDKLPFAVFLSGKSIYRISDYEHNRLYAGGQSMYVSNDVTYKFVDLNIALVQPVVGHGIMIVGDAKKDESMFNLIFNNVDKEQRFIWIIVNHDSFPTLISLLKYLRNSRFSFDWRMVPRENNCVISFAKNVEYKALN